MGTTSSCPRAHPNNTMMKRETTPNPHLLLRRIESIDSTPNTYKVRHFLQIKRNSTYLYCALFCNFCNDLLLTQRPFIFQDTFNDFRDCPWLVPPFLECIESTTDKNKLRIADKLVMHRLDRHILMIKLFFANMIGNIHEMKRMSCLLEHNLHLIPDTSGTDKAPLGQSPPILHLTQTLIHSKATLNEFQTRHPITEKLERLHRSNKFIHMHARFPLSEHFHEGIFNKRNVIHDKRGQAPEWYKRARTPSSSKIAVNGKSKA